MLLNLLKHIILFLYLIFKQFFIKIVIFLLEIMMNYNKSSMHDEGTPDFLRINIPKEPIPLPVQRHPFGLIQILGIKLIFKGLVKGRPTF